MSMLTFAKQRKERAAAIAAAQADLVAVEAARYTPPEPAQEDPEGLSGSGDLSTGRTLPVDDVAEEKPVKARRGRRKTSDQASVGRDEADDGDDGSAE